MASGDRDRRFGRHRGIGFPVVGDPSGVEPGDPLRYRGCPLALHEGYGVEH